MNVFLKRVLNKNFLKYIATGYISTLLNILVNVLLIKTLSPSLFGKITLGKSIFQSFEYSHLGLRFGLDRFLPYYSNLTEKNQIFSVALIFSLISSILFVLTWLLYDFKNYIFYLTFSLSGVLYALSTIYRVYYRASEDKNNFTNLSFWILIIPVLLQIIGLISFGFWGFIFFYLIGYCLSYLICIKFYSIKIIFETKTFFPNLKKLFSHGYLLFISAIINFLSSTGDRFIIAKYWGLELTGGFSVIMFFFTALTIFSLSYTELIMNKIILNPTFGFIVRHITFVCIISTVLIIIAYFAIPFIVTKFIPAYTDYIYSINIILIGIIPYTALPILNYYFHAIDKRNVVLYLNIINTFIYFTSLFFVLLNYKQMEILVFVKLLSILFITFATFFSFLYFEKKKISCL